MEKIPPALQTSAEKLRSHVYHWSHVTDLTYRAFGVQPPLRRTVGDTVDADRSTLVNTVMQAKSIDQYLSDRDWRQTIVDGILDTTCLSDEVEATFDWEDYADFVGDVVDYFDDVLKVGAGFDIVSAA